ncbi:MAG: class I SAM-dependent methyltransferase [Eubacteriales bacterium]
MENNTGDKRAYLSSLILDLYLSKSLEKVVFSKPADKNEIKSTLTPKNISGKGILQLETFSKDNKAYHKNISDNFESEIYALIGLYFQINVISTSGNCQYMRSKSGKETLIDAEKVRKSLLSGSFAERSDEGNDKVKKYILSGNETFLKGLGISDANGRVHDKMQSKYRQINRFIEHIKAIENELPKDSINIYDLCCGKSYLSFAVYHYFVNVLKIRTYMVCVDLKSDVIDYCKTVAKKVGFSGMNFICDDVSKYQPERKPDLVISLHACDLATDMVLDKACENGAKVILSTPCCHHELNKKIDCKELEFVTRHSMLRQKMCDALTDAMRILKLESKGYSVDAVELIDPEDTPKNIMIRAIKKENPDKTAMEKSSLEYERVEKFLMGENKYGN